MGYIYALSAGITWAVLGIYGTTLSRYGLTGNDVGFIRMFFGFLVGMIYIFRDKKMKKTIAIESIRHMIVIGVVTQGIMNIMLYKSIIIVGTVTATMLLCTGPIFTVLLSAFILKEKVNLQKKIALSIASIGAVALVTEGDFRNVNFDIVGISLGCLAGLCYGLFPILSRQVKKGDSPVVMTVYSFLIGSVVISPTVNLDKVFELATHVKPLLIMITFGLIPTFVSYLLFLKSMEYIDTSKASIIAMIEIPISALIGVFILKESFNAAKLIGIILIISGIMITKLNLSKMKKDKYKATLE